MSVVDALKSTMGSTYTPVSCLGSTALSVLFPHRSFCTTNLEFLTFNSLRISVIRDNMCYLANVGKSRTHDLFVSQAVIQSRKSQEESLHNRL